MTFITWACLRCVQELATILGPENPTQRSCVLVLSFLYQYKVVLLQNNVTLTGRVVLLQMKITSTIFKLEE